MTLSPTYYDFVRKLRPYVVDLAEQDAKDLLASAKPLATIHSVDDYNSRFAQCIEQVWNTGIRRTANWCEYRTTQTSPCRNTPAGAGTVRQLVRHC
jgi:hypothetical protein